MDEKRSGSVEREGVRERERALSHRESSVHERESVAAEREFAADTRDEELAAREDLTRLREEALRARAEAEEVRVDRERLLVQMREANERLVLATVRAEQLVDEANAAREAADENEERFRSLVTTSAAVVWRADAHGRIRLDRASWLAFTGASPYDVGAADGWFHAVHPDDLDRAREQWRYAIANVTPYINQHRLRTRDGGYAWVIARAVPILRAGIVREWTGMMVDVTDRVRIEESRELFIAMLGHDLRTPLTAILSGGELLEQAPPGLSPTQARVVSRIIRGARRMEAMIRDVMDFTRGRLGGGIPVVLVAGDLGRISSEAVLELQQAYPDRAIAGDASGDLRGEWDRDRVEQVISNLVGNAVAHGADPIRVRVRDEGDEVVLSVHNMGAPIPPELLPSLFEPFTRGERARTRRGDGQRGLGLGLGLFIVSEIVRAHGGTVSVSSTNSEGTQFIVRLPRDPAARHRIRAWRATSDREARNARK